MVQMQVGLPACTPHLSLIYLSCSLPKFYISHIQSEAGELYDERGIASLEQFDGGGSSSHLSTEQEEALKAYITQTLPRSTRQIGAFIERDFGVIYESHAGLIKLLYKIKLKKKKIKIIKKKINKEKKIKLIKN